MLVGSDLSPGAGSAFALAQRLAPDARFRLVHVVPSAASLGVVGSDVAALEDAVRVSTDEARAELQAVAEAAGPGVEVAVVGGSPTADLARAAEAFDADLVVVGARGHTRARDLLLGSIARGVLRRAKRSVLVARGDAAPRVIGVGTDFSPAAEKAATVAAALAHAGTDLVLFHAADTAMWGEAENVRDRAPAGERSRAAVEAALRRRVEALAAERLPRAKVVVASGRPVETGARIARDEGMDLLVVGDHGPGRVERALIGSVAEGLAERAPCSVLVAR